MFAFFSPFSRLTVAVLGLAVLAAAPPARAEVAEGPALWRIKDKSDVYLFASLHLLDPETAQDASWRTATIEKALARADAVWFEADTTSKAAAAIAADALREKGDNPPGVTLTGRLGKDAPLLPPVADALGAPAQAFDPMRPWKAYLIVNMEMMRQSGYDPASEPGRDLRLLAEAQEKKINYLLSSEEEFAALTDLDARTEDSLLRASLQTFAETRDSLPTLIAAWGSGDMDAVDILMNEPLRLGAPLAYDALVVQRNRTWVEKIGAIAKGKKDAFVVLGARHLAGPDSVVEILREAGFDVERVAD